MSSSWRPDSVCDRHRLEIIHNRVALKLTILYLQPKSKPSSKTRIPLLLSQGPPKRNHRIHFTKMASVPRAQQCMGTCGGTHSRRQDPQYHCLKILSCLMLHW